MPSKPPQFKRQRKSSAPRIMRDVPREAPAERGYDKRWYRLARVIRERDLYLCQTCGQPGNQVDHIIHKTIRPDLHYEPSNLQVLCGSCHAKKTAQEQAHFRRLRE